MKKHAMLILAVILSFNFTFAQDAAKRPEARLSVITKLVPTAVESNRIYLNLKSLDK